MAFRELVNGEWQVVACPHNECDGSGQIFSRDKKGYACTSHCRCFYTKKCEAQWKRTVGTHDQWVRLGKLVPSDKSALPTKVQQQCIDIMKGDPFGNYCMLGPSGASKTTYTVALYRRALYGNPDNLGNVIRIKAKTLLDTIQKFRYDRDNFNFDREPLFTTAEKIRRASANGNRTHVFLEELEKVRYTENRSTEIFDVLDSIYEEGGQLVCTGNLTYVDLNDTNKFIEGFVRRIDELCGKHKWDFWKNTKEEK